MNFTPAFLFFILLIAFCNGQETLRRRNLNHGDPRPFVVSYGGEPPAHAFPLSICEGDCDTDSDVSALSVVFQLDFNLYRFSSCAVAFHLLHAVRRRFNLFPKRSRWDSSPWVPWWRN